MRMQNKSEKAFHSCSLLRQSCRDFMAGPPRERVLCRRKRRRRLVEERAALLFTVGDLLRERKFNFCAWLVFEVSKNWAEADADIAETISCAYLAAITLFGLDSSMLLGWWWVQYVAAFALLIWLVPETREALEANHG